MPAETIPAPSSWRTAGGVIVRRHVEALPHDGATQPLIDALDTRPGVLLASSYDYPGRYVRFDLGFTDPPLVFTARMTGLAGAEVEIRALNGRGRVLLPAITRALGDHPHVTGLMIDEDQVTARILDGPAGFPEEERSRRTEAGREGGSNGAMAASAARKRRPAAGGTFRLVLQQRRRLICFVNQFIKQWLIIISTSPT